MLVCTVQIENLAISEIKDRLRHQDEPYVVLDLEGDLDALGRMSLVSLESSGQVYLFDLLGGTANYHR